MNFPRILRLSRPSRLRLAVLGASGVASLAFACGGISDPTRGGSENVATVSGALTGTSLPANARVALVWRKPGASGSGSIVEVGTDVPVIAGKFTMNVGAPSAAYFQSIDGASFSDNSSPPPGVVKTEPAPAPAPSSGGGSSSGGGARSVIGTNLTPRDIVGGGITEPLSAAVSGFVVYADTNGNGKLDLAGEYASSTDQILGGNSELLLAYLQGGGALDYEKLRDKSGILPAAGFNLAWSKGRWLPLNVVELKLTGAGSQLPSAVCSSGYYGGYATGSSSSGSAGSAPSDPNTAVPPPSSGSSGGSSSGGIGYPSPTDPNLSCSPDGRSYSYGVVSNCPPSPPPPVGLCAGDGVYETTACAGGRYTSSLAPGDAVPPGWPCATPGSVDGGSADSGVDAGPFDAGGGG